VQRSEREPVSAEPAYGHRDEGGLVGCGVEVDCFE
jgi:hypothetical protein